MRSVRTLVLGLALLAGCKPDPHRLDAGPPWWKPAPGEYADWDIQLAGTPFDISAPRAMYVIDLWDAVPAPTPLDYGDGTAPLMVPAGAHPTAISDLHTRTPPAIVVCQVGTGAIRLDDPDAARFPGHEASPPNRPTLPSSGSVIGWSRTVEDPSERFIDIRPGAQLAKVASLMGKRIELAKTIGCDAVSARHNDMIAYEGTDGHGFGKIAYVDYVSWTTELTARAHDGTPISIGQGDGATLAIDDTSRRFDFLIEQRCGERQDCDQIKPYTNKAKAVFEIEYDIAEDGMPNTAAAVCSELTRVGSIDGIMKSDKLDSSVYMRCP